MIGPLEILLILAVLGGLLLLQTKTRAGSMALYVAVGALLLLLIVATRIIRSLAGAIIVLVLLGAVLLWARLERR